MTEHRYQCKWISVEERLPETSHIVFAHDKELGFVMATYHERDSGHDNNWHIQPFKGNWDKCDCSITHWSLIPDLPKLVEGSGNKCVCRDCRYWRGEGDRDGMCRLHIKFTGPGHRYSCCNFEEKPAGNDSKHVCKNCKWWWRSICKGDEKFGGCRRPGELLSSTEEFYSCCHFEERCTDLDPDPIPETRECGNCRHWTGPPDKRRVLITDCLGVCRRCHAGVMYVAGNYSCGWWEVEEKRCKCAPEVRQCKSCRYWHGYETGIAPDQRFCNSKESWYQFTRPDYVCGYYEKKPDLSPFHIEGNKLCFDWVDCNDNLHYSNVDGRCAGIYFLRRFCDWLNKLWQDSH